VNTNKEDYVATHAKLVINIATGVARELEWGCESTIEMFVYAT